MLQCHHTEYNVLVPSFFCPLLVLTGYASSPLFYVSPNIFLHRSKFNVRYLKQKTLFMLPSDWLNWYPWNTQIANCFWICASGLPVWGWYFTAQQHRPALSKLTGVLFFPFVAVVFLACYSWEMTFVISLSLHMPLGLTVVLTKVIGETFIGFSSNCIR